MASIVGLRRKVKEWKPFVQSCFVVYLIPPSESPITDPDEQFKVVEVTDPSSDLLPKITTSKRQLKIARAAIEERPWNVLVGTLDGEPVGWIWETHGTEKALANGVPRMKLASDECLMFDLYVQKEYRRGGIAFTMADYFFKKYADGDKVVYGFISYENSGSILWHHSIGFNIAQTFNYLSIGPWIKWKIPFSDVPRFGPMSRKGRHTDPEKELFGPSLMPI